MVDQRYMIHHWEIRTTRFGRQVTVSINDKQYFLPSRFNTLTDDDIATYNMKQISLIYKGHKKFGNYPPTAILEFEDY